MHRDNSGDQNFDAIANKFQNNIYGTTKGRLRHELLLHHIQQTVPLTPDMRVLDAGGGTGMMSRELLALGCQVTLNDISADSLALAKQLVAQNPNQSSQALQFIHAPIQQIQPSENSQPYDLIICHAVLEWLQSPLQCIDHLIKLLRPNGYLSLSFFNRDALLFGNVLYGNFAYVNADLKVRNKVRLNPQNPQRPQYILDHLASLPVQIIKQVGVRCFHDYLKTPEQQQQDYESLKQLELQYGQQHPYKWLGKYFQVIITKS